MYGDGFRVVQKLGMATRGGATAKFRVIQSGDPENILGEILIQPGAIPDVGVIGWTNECLLAVVRERLQEFQAGEFSCDENAQALVYVNQALTALEERTAKRIANKTEGKYVK